MFRVFVSEKKSHHFLLSYQGPLAFTLSLEQSKWDSHLQKGIVARNLSSEAQRCDSENQSQEGII